MKSQKTEKSIFSSRESSLEINTFNSLYVRMISYIFKDPYFIRKNTIVNLLYSNFKPEDFTQSNLPSNYSDLLWASYHNLTWEDISAERRYTLSLIFNVISEKSHECSDLDWFYIERCTLHFVNFTKPVSNHIHSILERN